MVRKKAIGRARPDRVQDTELYWAGKLAKATTPRQRAYVEWDRLRVELSKLPRRAGDDEWTSLATNLAARRQRLNTNTE